MYGIKTSVEIREMIQELDNRILEIENRIKDKDCVNRGELYDEIRITTAKQQALHWVLKQINVI